MKKLLITLMVIFSVILTSCGESNNSASSNDSESDSQVSNSSASSGQQTRDTASPEGNKQASAYDGTDETAQALLEEWLIAHPLGEGTLSIKKMGTVEAINQEFHNFHVLYDDVSLYQSFLVEKQTGELYASNSIFDEVLTINEWFGIDATSIDQQSPYSDGASYGAESNFIARVTAEPSLRLRSGPGSEYDTITNILYQEIVEFVYEWDPQSEWTMVQYDGLSGWVSTEYLEPYNATGGSVTKEEARSLLEDTTKGNPGSSQSLVATDLLGQWIWDTNNSTYKEMGENTLKQVTFLSNGTCSGGVAIHYNNSEPTFFASGGVEDANIVSVQYWEFLEYEQVLQLQALKYSSGMSNGAWKTTSREVIVNFKVHMVDGVLYLENSNDSSTAIIQYNKNE